MRYNEISEAKPKTVKPKTVKPKKSNPADTQNFLRMAGGYGYELERLPEHFWSAEEVYAPDIEAIYRVEHFEDGADEGDFIGRAYSEEEAVEIIKRHAVKHEPELMK